jgi:hypothetical protein
MKKNWTRHLEMSEYIEESEMSFISDDAFRIENSDTYKTLRGKGIKTVEFVRALNNEKLAFIEAKKSFANPENPLPGNLAKFESEAGEICEKFLHSLNLFASVKIGVYKETLPEIAQNEKTTSLVFVLVVKYHNCKGCKMIETKIEKLLPAYLKAIWKPEIRVVNYQKAITLNLAVMS